MEGGYSLLELNEHADRVAVYLYVDESVAVRFASYVESRELRDDRSECLEASLVSVKGELWLEVRGGTGISERPSFSGLAVMLRLPSRLEVRDVLSVSYYGQGTVGAACSESGSRAGQTSRVMFSRVVLSLRSKLSVLKMSTIATDLSCDQNGDLSCLDKDETVCLDLEAGSLSRLATSRGQELPESGCRSRLRVSCKECGALVSEYPEDWTPAPLPSEMFIHGSEMFTCDNCCPVFSEASRPHCVHNFGPRLGWICLGLYHISVHTDNVLCSKLLFGAESVPEDSIEAFFIRDINNIYYSGQKALESIQCGDCRAHLGWKNSQDGHINLWKSRITLSVLSGDRTILTLFSNYPITSLLALYLEKYLKKQSTLLVAERTKREGLADGEPSARVLAVRPLQKNVLQLKLGLLAGLQSDQAKSLARLPGERPILYSTIKVAYDLIDAETPHKHEQLVLLDKQQFGRLVTTLEENTLFSKNSRIHLPIFSSEFL
ncbi:hypothetical protein OJ252_343 [Cryptosporidium canis]|uniref:E3 ubiquitin-protein ligase E3D n=1 Tax=Cryptosporidium canis TaxID=195482 RepID=A0ABQ8PDC0_9CRYT|nr:hypothetical protein OJ252_343 [Cryptosporidium canis]